jgi:hypothetical protein
MPAITTIRFRRGTAAQWASTNPVLGAGEMGLETDTQKFKFGNGSSAWNSRPYAVAANDPTGVTVFWENVQNKPDTFPAIWSEISEKPLTFAPSAHTHTMAEITDLEFPPTTVMSDTPPSNPAPATRWIDTTTFIEYVFYDSYWVEV